MQQMRNSFESPQDREARELEAASEELQALLQKLESKQGDMARLQSDVDAAEAAAIERARSGGRRGREDGRASARWRAAATAAQPPSHPVVALPSAGPPNRQRSTPSRWRRRWRMRKRQKRQSATSLAVCPAAPASALSWSLLAAPSQRAPFPPLILSVDSQTRAASKGAGQCRRQGKGGRLLPSPRL